jgi:hypothetical protein
LGRLILSCYLNRMSMSTVGTAHITPCYQIKTPGPVFFGSGFLFWK